MIIKRIFSTLGAIAVTSTALLVPVGQVQAHYKNGDYHIHTPKLWRYINVRNRCYKGVRISVRWWQNGVWRTSTWAFKGYEERSRLFSNGVRVRTTKGYIRWRAWTIDPNDSYSWKIRPRALKAGQNTISLECSNYNN